MSADLKTFIVETRRATRLSTLQALRLPRAAVAPAVMREMVRTPALEDLAISATLAGIDLRRPEMLEEVVADECDITSGLPDAVVEECWQRFLADNPEEVDDDHYHSCPFCLFASGQCQCGPPFAPTPVHLDPDRCWVCGVGLPLGPSSCSEPLCEVCLGWALFCAEQGRVVRDLERMA